MRADVRIVNPAAETIVRASCPECGDVEMALTALVLRVCMDDARGAYTFDCPRCAERVTKPADTHVVEVLLASGVHLETWSFPAELAEPRSGPPLTHDEILEFHRGFEDPDWFARLAATVTP